MYLNSEKVANAVICAARVLEQPKIFGGDRRRIPISIEEIYDFVAAESGYSITKANVSYTQQQYIRGRLEKWKEKVAKIHVANDQDLNWKRLVATKELLHLIIDDDSDMCPYGDEVLDTLVLEGYIGILSPLSDKGHPKQSELIAEIAAMEVLYPLECRLDDLELLAAKTLTISKISLQYKIPEGIASTLVNGRYIGFIKQAFDETKKIQSENSA